MREFTKSEFLFRLSRAADECQSQLKEIPLVQIEYESCYRLALRIANKFNLPTIRGEYGTDEVVLAIMTIGNLRGLSSDEDILMAMGARERAWEYVQAQQAQHN